MVASYHPSRTVKGDKNFKAKECSRDRSVEGRKCMHEIKARTGESFS